MRKIAYNAARNTPGLACYTKRESYEAIQTEGKAESDENLIFSFLLEREEGKTRNEISRELKLSINNVCGRVNALIKKESCFEYGMRRDTKTKKKNSVVWATR